MLSRFKVQFAFAARPASTLYHRSTSGITRRLQVAGLFLLLQILAGRLWGETPASLTSLGQVRKLPPSEGAKGLPVKVCATVTYSDPSWRTVFLQDSSGCTFLERDPGQEWAYDLQPGQQVEVEGITTAGLIHCNVKARQLKSLPLGPMPLPIELAGRNAFTDELEGRWVRVSGWVSGLGNLGNRRTLKLVVYPGKSLTVINPTWDWATVRTFRWTRVEVQGVFARELTPDGKGTGEHLLFLSRPSDAHMLDTLSVLPIGELHQPGQHHPSSEPVRIRGQIELPRGPGPVLVRDTTGCVAVELAASGFLGNGSQVEVFGFPVGHAASLMLTNTTLSSDTSAAAGPPVKPQDPVQPDPKLATLTQAIQVRDLSPQKAAQGYPVHVRGVLTYFNVGTSHQFLQDDSAGIYLEVLHVPPTQLSGPGHRVEVEGFSGPGDYAPVIHVQHFQELGPADFPPPKPTTLETLMSGQDDSQWVALKGVVRSLTTQSNLTQLELSTRQGLVSAIIADPAGQPAGLIDSVVEVHGVSQTLYSTARRLLGVELLVPNWSQIELKEAAPEDPFQLPVQPINELFEFHVGNNGLHRARLQGHVLLCRPDGSFYLQDASAGILIQLKGPGPKLQPNMPVEVAGFPAMADRVPVLQDALLKPLVGGTPVEPVSLQADAPLDETLQSTLVWLSGRVLNQSLHGAQERLSVQFGPWVTEAVFHPTARQHLPGIEAGSLVRLTGVFVTRLDETRKVQSFQVLLRGPGDLVVLQRPPWWTTRHILWVLAGLGGLLVLVLSWVGLLRNQVRQRTSELREEIEERKRMQVQVEQTHRQLLETSRQAGMAEVATSVLHNVGNVLNSVNVSTSLATDLVKGSKAASLGRVVDLLREHEADLGTFITQHPRGKFLPAFLGQLNQQLAAENTELLRELSSLTQNVEHIKEIVAMQQNYSKVMGVAEKVSPVEMVEDALRLNAAALERHQVRVRRDFDSRTPEIIVEKHKVLQVLVNLIRNAKYACEESGRTDKILTLNVQPAPSGVRIDVSDNGVGIAPENLTRIFQHGFTTRKNGHGFGLHNGALAAKELGGDLRVHSAGLGLGACFSLELPLDPPAAKTK